MTEVAPAVAPVSDIDLSAQRTSVDVMILMDCTGSMGSWIHAAKTEALATAEELRKAAPNATFRLGFVGYRDHCDAQRFDIIPLQADVDAVQRALQPIAADGGGDTPEDVAGGLQKVLEADWTAETKVIIMVADAPAHGKEYNAGHRDDYPEGDPTGLDPKAQLKEVARRGMDFYFIKCESSTNDMVKIFLESFESAKASEEQIFSVLDLQAQGAGGSLDDGLMLCAPVSRMEMAMPVALSDCHESGCESECDDYDIASLSVSDRCMPSMSEMEAPMRSMMMAPMAPMPSSSASGTSAFREALTSSVKRSMASRVPGKASS